MASFACRTEVFVDPLALIVAGIALLYGGSTFLDNEERAHPFMGPGIPAVVFSLVLMLAGIVIFLLGTARALLA